MDISSFVLGGIVCIYMISVFNMFMKIGNEPRGSKTIDILVLNSLVQFLFFVTIWTNFWIGKFEVKQAIASGVGVGIIPVVCAAIFLVMDLDK